MTAAPTPQPDAERVQGEVTAAVERGQGALSSHPLFGCGCCTWPEEYDEKHPDGCPREDGYTDHTYEGACWREQGRASILTVDILATALDVEEIARVLGRHDEIEWGNRDRTDRCKCGHDLETGGPSVDTAYLALNEHVAHMLRAAILGGAA